MIYKTLSFRNADAIFENDSEYSTLWKEIKDVLDNISDKELVASFNSAKRTGKKSISEDINKIIDKKLVEKGWSRQSPIFNDSVYRPKGKSHWWTLDFAKGEIAIEVAFNHGEATAWNLIKPVLSSELNHVKKAKQTSAGVIITATDALKKAGTFDNAAGSYEKFLQYLDPFRNILTVPMMIIGLEPPTSFKIQKSNKKVVLIP
ncbi:MAG: BglII/BstYI family type II restriction endonuclease [Syntrophomonadaceae bacterium]|nr:BglII/BstYI family type II restriction endonuclease [Syntrophomonadaceae bacterium]